MPEPMQAVCFCPSCRRRVKPTTTLVPEYVPYGDTVIQVGSDEAKVCGSCGAQVTHSQRSRKEVEVLEPIPF